MTMNTTRRTFMKTLSATVAVAGTAGIAQGADAELTEKVIAIVNQAYPEAVSAPEVVRSFAVALQKEATPRLEPLSFVMSEGAKGSESFERYVTVEFSIATNIAELDEHRKLQLNWK